MRAKTVPVHPSPPRGNRHSASTADAPDAGDFAALSGLLQISMQDLETLKALSRELMGLIVAMRHRS
ncbi:MAG TPA: hypothetical protein VL966_06410 [Alphaproteobacteria bacterium]|jgi:hypothetical protein|nr:hypothetical protein [Alphaproteobacteria bacterium]